LSNAAGPEISEIKGNRDLLWPVPGIYKISGCFIDKRNHHAIDIPGYKDDVIASYDGKILEAYDSGSGYGKCILLEHDYKMRNGETIKLYTKYNHLDSILVDKDKDPYVKAGQVIAKVGASGGNYPYHLDYQVMTSPDWHNYNYHNISIDPFVNDLMQQDVASLLTGASSSDCCVGWPSECCCYRYVQMIKERYSVPLCEHKNLTSLGVCQNSNCSYVYDWSSTYETSSAGLYEVSKLTGIWLRTDVPYEASENKASTKITYGKEVEVLGSVKNAHKNTWYKVSYKGEIGYTSADNLKFKSRAAQQITCENFVPTHGATIPKADQPLMGTVVSKYPLTKIVAYLDGKEFATWNAPDKNTTTVELRGTDVNYNLVFSALSSGKHTIELKGVDIYRTTLTTFHTSYFYTETSTPEPIYYTVIYNPNGGSCGTNSASVKENTEIGALPTPTREGYEFNGWYTAAVGGNQITANTVFTSNKTIYAQWTPVYYTVSYDTQSDSGVTYDSIEVQHGYTLGELPTPTRRGYDFIGWYTAAAGGTNVTAQTKVTAAMTLYAHWNPVTVVVTFDANGGTVGVTQKTVTYDQVYGDLPTPTRSGYTFVRWNREGFGTVTSDTILEWYLDHTLVAQWEKTVYEVPGGKIYFDATTGMITGADAKITSADIPDIIAGTQVVGIADKAFYYCSELTNVIVPNSVKVIGNEAFAGCRKLTAITLGTSVTRIGDDAFRNCYDLTAIALPASLTHIGEGSFYNCSALENVVIPANVVQIGELAFDNCFGLASINVDLANTKYTSDNGVLMSKDKTELIYCPEGIADIDSEYIVPNGVLTIYPYAFDDSNELSCIVIPKSVTNIDVTAFKESTIEVSAENLYYSSVGGVLFNKDKTVLLYYPDLSQNRYDVPAGVVEIGEKAFLDSNLLSVYLPEGVQTIGAEAFRTSFSLYDVNLPSTLKVIGDEAFLGCHSLKTIDIPQNVSQIGINAFMSCEKLEKVYFHGDAPQIGERAFVNTAACLYYRDWMTGWTSPSYNGCPSAVWESRFAVEGGYIYYDVIEGYVTDCDNSVSDIVIPAEINGTGIVGIDSNAFSKCTKAKSITIPEGLTGISMRAFTGGSIETVIYHGTIEQWLGHRVTTSYVLDGVSIQCIDKSIPANLTHVGLCSNGILWHLSTEGLLTVDGVGAIEDYASGTAPWNIFLAPVREIVISEGITRIGAYSFYDLYAKKVTIPGSCVSIGDKAFKDCSLLQTVVIPNGVKEIGREAFCDCKALSEITISTSVDTLGYRAFNNSAESTTVYYAGSKNEWNIMVKERTPSYFDEGVQIYCDGSKLPENTIYMGTAGEDIEWFLSVEGTLTITGTGPMVSDYEIRVDYAPGDWYYDYGCSWEYYESKIVNVIIEEGITSISRNAFLQHEMLESVAIPSTVTKIEEAAFNGCVKLQHITIENGVTSIEASAFAGCSSLEDITIPYSVSNLGHQVFANCTGLTTVIFEDGSLSELPYYAFWHCESLQNVDLPDSLVDIGYLSFVGCKSLKTLHIPEKVETCTLMNIGSDTGIETFTVDSDNKHLSCLDGILFDKSVSVLHLYPQAKTAESYYLPETVTTISEEAFFGNTYLKTVTIPANIYEIGDRAFFECTGLKGVYFVGQSPYYEGEDVFKKYVEGSNTNYENLTNVVIYYLEDEYYNGGWYGSSYDEYKMDTWEFEVIEYRVTGGTIYFETITGRIIDADTSITAATIPAQINGWYVTSIGESAFEECTSLTSITLPNTITRIESDAFSYCYNLGSINLPDSVSFIGSDAFSGCSSLTSIVIPEGVTEIPTWAFDYCRKLASITIPRSVKTIQYAAFEECESLNHILYHGTAEEWAMIDVVEEDNDYLLNARTLHCEASGTELYAKKSCTYSGMCCSMCDEFVYGSQLDSDEHDFQDFVCTRCDAPQVLRYTLKENGEAVVKGIGVYWYGIEIEVPSHIEGCRVVEIADNAFVQVPIKNIVIPDTVETIGSSAFLWCNSLENVIIGSGLKSMNMPGSVFDSCEKLKGIWVDPDNKCFSSDDYGVLFSKDYSTLIKYPDAGPATYTVPNEVITIGQSAFSESTNLEVVYMGSSVTVIELSAFSSCKKLKEVYLNEALTSIENYAFYQCKILSDVYYSGTSDQWDNVSIWAENDSLLTANLHTADSGVQMPGDMNGDGESDTLDRMTLSRYLANWDEYSAENMDLSAADVNGDGVVDTLDRMILSRHLANWEGYEELPVN